ncbi:MAG TPA: tetratricopeptide repeat protein [Bryobacteraceae bacterium]|nr:tetratricopeptide repeat protein [Bryobacteraceae bacterium]
MRAANAGILLLLPLTALCAQSPTKQRDLKYEAETAPAAPSVSIPRSYALVIGVAKYPKLPPQGQLDFAEQDAQAMYSILISPEGGNFHAEDVHRLIGGKATLADMRRELEQWLPSVAKDDDRVLIYFAGHGFVYRGRAYLAPYDLDPNNISGTGYPMETLGQAIGGKIHAKWKVLLTDACHSGAITPEDTAQQINRSLLALNQSLFSLTASRDRERSYESKDWGGGHGVFTYYVVKGLEGEADESGDGIVTADELADYVYRNVRDATKGQQNPTFDRGSFDPNMLLAYLPSGYRAGHPPPPKEGTLIFESNMDGVEVFVDGKSVGVVAKGQPLRLPGILPGTHTIQGVKMGYEPDGPRDQIVYPGQESTVSIKILIARRRPRAAVEEFDKGIQYYNKGFADNYKKAVENFQKALDLDPTYSQAALYLGRTYNSLFDEGNSEKYFRRAIEIDPDYIEARVSFAGMLLDKGDVDEAIRQLDISTRREPKNEMALYLQAQAYRMKQMYPQSIDSARAAIQLTPNNGEAHFWLAEALRMSGKYPEAESEYGQYLRLSNFDSKLAGKIDYYAVGFLIGMGKKKRAAQRDTWKDLRNLAYFGLCDSERKLSHYETAIGYCQKALAYDSQDPYAHYDLGLCYAHIAQQTGSLETLSAASTHFQAMLAINPDLQESGFARKNLQSIDTLLQAR